MKINLVIDLLNRIIENKIEIWDINDHELESTKEEFLSNNKRSADREIVSLIVKHTDIVYKYIHNQLKIEYKLRFFDISSFKPIKSKNKITLEFEYYDLNLDELEILDDLIKKVKSLIDGNSSLSYNILYLLPFKNGEYFKFGISSQKDLHRVNHIDNLYQVDFQNSVIYYGLKPDIQLVENYIKKITSMSYNNPYKGKDGYSEIREFSLFKRILHKCDDQFRNDFSFIKYELKNLELDKWRNELKSRVIIKKDVSNSFESIPELDLPDIFFIE